MSNVSLEPLQVVELVQPRCALTYGSSPCTAEVGVTGNRKCFNTRKTCQDPDNYNPNPNLCANPGFEDGDTAWTKGTTWSILSDANARTGSWVARKTAAVGNRTSISGTAVACLPGERFTATCWLKSASATSDTCRIAFRWLNSSMAAVLVTAGTGVSLTTSYQQATVSGTAPAGSAFVRVEVAPPVANAHTIYLDDVELRGPSEIVWRFTRPVAALPSDWVSAAGNTIRTNPLPFLANVSTSPTRLNIGGGSTDSTPLGVRASVNVTLRDAPWDDSIEDKYLSERSYVPFRQGTFWSKWLARNPYHSRYTLRVLDGYRGQLPSEMQSRTYLVDRINGPDANGAVTITAKDPLRLADDKRTRFPPPSDIALVDAIDSTQTSGVEVSCAESELTADYGNTGSTRYLRFGDEILSYTGYTGGPDTFTLTGVTRAAVGTTGEEHDIADNGQRVGRYESMPVWEIAADLLLNYTALDPAFIDLEQWAEEGNAYLTPFSLTGTVAEPTAVSELLAELTEQCPFYIWWDERQQLIPLRVVRPPIGEAVKAINDNQHILAGSQQLREDPTQRISRIYLYFKQRDPTRPLNDVGNYRQVRLRIDADAESESEHGEVRVKQIFSRWLTSAGQAIHTTVRILARLRDQVQFLTFEVHAKDRDIKTADVVEVSTRVVVDDTGEVATGRWQVFECEEVMPGERIRYDCQRFTFAGRIMLWADEDAPDYIEASDDEKRDNGYFADEKGAMEDGDFGYQWV